MDGGREGGKGGGGKMKGTAVLFMPPFLLV